MEIKLDFLRKVFNISSFEHMDTG